MGEIKLGYSKVTNHINKAKNKLDDIDLKAFPSDLGENQLDYTTQWSSREDHVQEMVTQYIEAVKKNLSDTQANVRQLKEQDEEMVRN